MSKMKVTIEVEVDETTSHPRNWDWVELVGLGTEYVSTESEGV
jgi:hypothetical protein